MDLYNFEHKYTTFLIANVCKVSATKSIVVHIVNYRRLEQGYFSLEHVCGHLEHIDNVFVVDIRQHVRDVCRQSEQIENDAEGVYKYTVEKSPRRENLPFV